MWRFEASPRRAAPKGLPSSFAQHRIPKGAYLHPAPLFLRSWHTDITDFGLVNRDETGVIMTKIRDKSAGGEPF
jgi:hypothetical protein